MSAARGFRLPGRMAMVAVFALALIPALASACPVCGAGAKDRNNLAFLISTIFLSLMPLAAIGAGVWWLRNRARRLEREEFPGSAVPADSAG